MRNGLAALNVAGTATAWTLQMTIPQLICSPMAPACMFSAVFSISMARHETVLPNSTRHSRYRPWAPELTYFGSPNAPSLVGIDGSDVIAIGNFDAVNGASFAGQVRINRSTGAPAALGIAGLSTSNLPRTLTLDGGRAYLGEILFRFRLPQGHRRDRPRDRQRNRRMPALTSEASQPVLATLVSGGDRGSQASSTQWVAWRFLQSLLYRPAGSPQFRDTSCPRRFQPTPSPRSRASPMAG